MLSVKCTMLSVKWQLLVFVYDLVVKANPCESVVWCANRNSALLLTMLHTFGP
jgi:hypothetical protein